MSAWYCGPLSPKRMDGTEDDLLWEEPENNSEASGEQDVYDDQITQAEFDGLFGQSDDDEFEGFESSCYELTVLQIYSIQVVFF